MKFTVRIAIADSLLQTRQPANEAQVKTQNLLYFFTFPLEGVIFSFVNIVLVVGLT